MTREPSVATKVHFHHRSTAHRAGPVATPNLSGLDR